MINVKKFTFLYGFVCRTLENITQRQNIGGGVDGSQLVENLNKGHEGFTSCLMPEASPVTG